MQNASEDDCPVKLDIFHGINRVTRTIRIKKRGSNQKKKESQNKIYSLTKVQRRLFCLELSSCFRSDGDQRGQRWSPTPSFDVIEKNLDELLNRWKEKLSWKTIDALHNLQTHSKCLADIPPSCSSSKNETFHGVLRSFFYGKKQLSLQMFLSLLILKIVSHNRKIAGLSTPLVPGNFHKLSTVIVAPQDFHGIGLAKCIDEGRPLKYERTIHVDMKPIVTNSVLMHKLVENYERQSNYLNIQDALLFSPLTIIDNADVEWDIDTLRVVKQLGFTVDEQSYFEDIESALTNVVEQRKHDMVNISRPVPSDVLLKDVANMLGIAIILILSTKVQAIHSVIPKTLKSSELVCIVQKSTGIYVASPIVSPVIEDDTSYPFRCRCGRKRSKEDNFVSCSVGSKCSWQQGKFCSARCTCFNCQNGKKSKESKVRSCRCEAGCIQNRCPCFSNQFSCEANPVCRCKNCKNPKGSIHFVEDVEANSALGIRKRCIGKVETNRSSLYSAVRKISSPWTSFETLLLHQISAYLTRPTTNRIWGVFNLVVEKYPALNVRAKTLNQINGKLNHLKECLFMFNK